MTVTAETMFDRRGAVRPVARATDPDTSHRAAALATLKAGSNRVLALEALRAAGERGLTDFELEAATSIPQTSIGKRRHDLWRLGLVEKTEMRRPSPSGAPAIVWRATDG
jgi:hypothetical protein